MAMFIKDPSAVLDYRWDWASWLQEGEAITAVTVTADTGITVDSSAFSSTTVTAWLSGGTAGQRYRIGARITTSQGRIDERSIRVGLEER